MKTTRLRDLFTWSAFQPDRGIDFNGFFWRRPGGGVLIDPLSASAAQKSWVGTVGGARWIIVTSAEHWRATSDWQSATGAGVLAPTSERERLGDRAQQVTGWFGDGDDLPADLADAVAVHWIRGGKAPLEPALYLRGLRAVLFGDIVRSHVSGVLRLLPDDKLTDPAAVRADLLAMRDLNVDAILLGDGDSLFVGARGAWLELLRGLGTRLTAD